MNRQFSRLWRLYPLVACVAGLLVASTSLASSLPGPLVETGWLAKNLKNVVVLDVRPDQESFIKKSRGGIAGMQACGAGGGGEGRSPVSGHIPGASFIPWDQVRADTQDGDNKIVGELPKNRTFARWMTRSGVKKDSMVVIASVGQTAADAVQATRLYWTLKYFGHDQVAILNGGTAKWADEGREIEYGRARRKRGDFKPGSGRPELLAHLSDVQKAIDGSAQLIDVRPQDLYLGLTHNPRFTKPHAKGHIPTAKSFPFTMKVDFMGPAATYYEPDKVKKLSELLGVDPDKPSIIYCETGGQAAVSWFVFHELLGNDKVSIYDGSMNEWSASKSRPVVSMKFE